MDESTGTATPESSARVLAHSVSPTGVEIFSVEAHYPRIVHAELLTHRTFSRSAASSRAIRVAVTIEKVLTDPFVPIEFTENEPGMQGKVVLSGDRAAAARESWLEDRDQAVYGALQKLLGTRRTQDLVGTRGDVAATKSFRDPATIAKIVEALNAYEKHVKALRADGGDIGAEYLNVHKQTANRPLEPFSRYTVIVTATDFSNFDALRISEFAQPELRRAAEAIKAARAASTPRELGYGDFHLPLVQPEEREEAAADPERWCRISVGRCARVSYLTHDGRRDPDADFALATRLSGDRHLSPFEHVATPVRQVESTLHRNDGRVEDLREERRVGNLRGWRSLRSAIPFEHDAGALAA